MGSDDLGLVAENPPLDCPVSLPDADEEKRDDVIRDSCSRGLEAKEEAEDRNITLDPRVFHKFPAGPVLLSDFNPVVSGAILLLTNMRFSRSFGEMRLSWTGVNSS